MILYHILLGDDSAGFALEGGGKVSDIGDDADAGRFAGESSGSFDFGEHGTGFEVAVTFEAIDFLDRNVVDDFGVRGAVVDEDIGNGSNRDENVGVDEFGEFLGGVIFVDNGIDAFEAF